jgi:predicted enzyme related to lactoylglutathione lyase
MPEVVAPYRTGTPCWVELRTHDQKAALAFYQEVFGWSSQVEAPETAEYVMCTVRDLPVAAIASAEAMGTTPAPPTMWTTYLAADDADATERAVTAQGGGVLLAATDVGEYGRTLVASDPSGAVFGVWQPLKSFGARLVNEPGSLIWSELNTRDVDAAGAFYRAVFGVGFSPMPNMPDYFVMDVVGRPVGGMQFLGESFPPGEPSHWMAYFSVADTDRTVRAVVRGGGSLIRPAFDIAAGRMAVLQDPQGGRFSVIAASGPAPERHEHR